MILKFIEQLGCGSKCFFMVPVLNCFFLGLFFIALAGGGIIQHQFSNEKLLVFPTSNYILIEFLAL